jgi:aspartate-semialdehyde dehydrogenase
VPDLKLAVVGATGAVGPEVLRVLEQRKFPATEVVAFASARSAGTRVAFAGTELEVRELTADALEGFDLALFSAGAGTSRTFAPEAVARGCVVVDKSSAYRMDPEVPLVVPEVNATAIDSHNGIVANPNCSTIQFVAVLKPLLDAVGLNHVTVATYQAVSGTGTKAMDELEAQTRAVIAGEPVEATVYPHQIAFNALPHCDVFDDDGNTQEETKLVRESRKILAQPGLPISATCVRIPVLRGHSEAVWIETAEPISPDAARELLARAPGVSVIDDPAANRYPTPLEAAGEDEVFVGRIRRDESRPNGLALWIVADNLRKGAATNGVQIAEVLVERDLVRVPGAAAA